MSAAEPSRDDPAEDVTPVDGGVLNAGTNGFVFDAETVRDLEDVGAPDWLVERAIEAAQQSGLYEVGAPEWLVERAARHATG